MPKRCDCQLTWLPEEFERFQKQHNCTHANTQVSDIGHYETL